jgi:hypothetical protein
LPQSVRPFTLPIPAWIQSKGLQPRDTISGCRVPARDPGSRRPPGSGSRCPPGRAGRKDPRWVSIPALAALGLVDEYRLMVHPVVVGTGKRLFGEGNAGTSLELAESRKAGPDVPLLIYRPATAAAE